MTYTHNKTYNWFWEKFDLNIFIVFWCSFYGLQVFVTSGYKSYLVLLHNGMCGTWLHFTRPSSTYLTPRLCRTTNKVATGYVRTLKSWNVVFSSQKDRPPRLRNPLGEPGCLLEVRGGSKSTYALNPWARCKCKSEESKDYFVRLKC